MMGALRDLPRDVREQAAAALRDGSRRLVDDLAAALADEPGLDPGAWRQCAELLIALLARTVEDGEFDTRHGGVVDLATLAPALTVRQMVHAVQRAERLTLDELALHPQLGATSEPWPVVAHLVRTAALELVAAFAEREGGGPPLRDTLTTLLSRTVFDLALAQEIQRAFRHQHGVALILFDIDNLGTINASHGYGAGDRLIERLGILARRFFRTHDWTARHGSDSIVVLLPETTVDQAAVLAGRFREMVRQRMVLMDHKTDAVTTVTVSAAAAGTEIVQADIDPVYVMEEAEQALLRAKMNGGNRVERVALLPTSVTIIGAATLLGRSPREIAGLLREGTLTAVRRGRHLHIDRAQIDALRRKA